MHIFDVALSMMLLCYGIALCSLLCRYQSNSSVSNLLADQVCRNIVWWAAIGLGITTIWYEWIRRDRVSLGIIMGLLIGLVGVFMIPEGNCTHTVSAFVVFGMIVLFMGYHIRRNPILMVSFILQCIWSVATLYYIQYDNHMFLGEALLILNFAFYYLYLHFISRKTLPYL